MTDSKNIQPQTRYTILLIGDSCIDEYKIGTVDRLSPEAPVPIIKITEEYVLPGMAGNVKKNIEKLGITECDFITNDGIIKKTRYIDKKSGQHILRVDSEAEIPPWSGRLWCRIDEFDAIIFSDYNKGFLTYENIEDIIKQTDIPIFIDTKKQNLDRKDFATKVLHYRHSSVLFSMLDGKSYEDTIWKIIKPKWSKPFKKDLDN